MGLMRVMCCAAAGCGALVLLQPALAINESNKQALAKHFTEQGTVVFDLYTPLGGPEIGAAVIDSSAPRLEVVEVKGRGDFRTLLTLSMPQGLKRQPYTFLLTGQHLLTYPTVEWQDDHGVAHRRGDLTVYDLISEGEPKKLFELKGVDDLSFAPGGALTADNLLWQPSRHFLNTSATLPQKNNYARLVLDESGSYRLLRHLVALPEAAIDDAANLNNRAIYFYGAGRLSEAARLLEQASQLAEGNQRQLSRNQALIKSELTDLAEQGHLVPDRPFDEALCYYWQGDFNACLRAMEGRSAFSDEQLALLGLALAQVKRWSDADRATVELERRHVPFLADYLAELVGIARFQRFYDVAQTYLLALQVTDDKHPGYATNLSAMQVLAGDVDGAIRTLEGYLTQQVHSGRDLGAPRAALYELYAQSGNKAGCDRLVADALAEPHHDLSGLVPLVDYVDLSASMSDVPAEERDRIKAPSQPLDNIGFSEGNVPVPDE
jgi:hypothetical protein